MTGPCSHCGTLLWSHRPTGARVSVTAAAAASLCDQSFAAGLLDHHALQHSTAPASDHSARPVLTILHWLLHLLGLRRTRQPWGVPPGPAQAALQVTPAWRRLVKWSAVLRLCSLTSVAPALAGTWGQVGGWAALPVCWGCHAAMLTATA